MIPLQIENPNKPQIADLIRQSDKYLKSLYPPECNYLMGVSTLLHPDIKFLTARDGQKYVGCGVLRVVNGQYGEIKRMFVLPSERGEGTGYKILAELQNIALQLDLNILRLETGINQPEAIKLYEKFGFHKISVFGEYKPNGVSLFYEKRIVVESG